MITARIVDAGHSGARRMSLEVDSRPLVPLTASWRDVAAQLRTLGWTPGPDERRAHRGMWFPTVRDAHFNGERVPELVWSSLAVGWGAHTARRIRMMRGRK